MRVNDLVRTWELCVLLELNVLMKENGELRIGGGGGAHERMHSQVWCARSSPLARKATMVAMVLAAFVSPRIEAQLFRDPKRGTIAQWNFKTSGDLDVSEVIQADSTGYELRGANTRSLIRRAGENEFEWELQVPRDTTWRTILRAVHRRRAP